MNIKISAIMYFMYLTFLFLVFELKAYSVEAYYKIDSTLSIMNYLKNNLSDEKLLYNIVPRGLVISVPVAEIFDDGNFDIKYGANDFLFRLGKIIKFINKPCVVEGNALTQKDSDDMSNLELSIMRADRLVEFFINKSGIPPLMIRGIGLGDMAPFDDNVSYKEHLNRRIDFVILNYEWDR